MAGTAITTLYDYVDDYVDGASDETAILNRAIINTMRVFCRLTHLWKETLDDISVSEDTNSYSLTAPTGNGNSEIIGLDEVKYKEDGADDDQYATLEIQSREYMDTYKKGWEFQDSQPTPLYAFFDHLELKLYIYPTPDDDSTDGLNVRVWLMPDYGATTAPAFLYNLYINQIARGVAGNMMQMTNQRWSNPELGDVLWSKFLKDCQNAQQDQDRGFSDIENYRAIPEIAFTGGSKSRSRGGLF